MQHTWVAGTRVHKQRITSPPIVPCMLHWPHMSLHRCHICHTWPPIYDICHTCHTFRPPPQYHMHSQHCLTSLPQSLPPQTSEPTPTNIRVYPPKHQSLPPQTSEPTPTNIKHTSLTDPATCMSVQTTPALAASQTSPAVHVEQHAASSCTSLQYMWCSTHLHHAGREELCAELDIVRLKLTHQVHSPAAGRGGEGEAHT